jgi:hypothetical protein
MFEMQTITIKSGEGKNYFESTAQLDSSADPMQTKLVMTTLREMQKDRMEWASNQQALGRREIASR